MATTGSEMWLQWFACCYQPAAQAQRTRRRIDRSMIGAPTNFQHTGHIVCWIYTCVPNSESEQPVGRLLPYMGKNCRSVDATTNEFIQITCNATDVCSLE
ncbi:unnamed protein product [Euphydryas editha]|uniref:CRIB domain-containing protein n=1 Tax=Euphydryas editha TaxID=104508 RepID=A0AAU9U9B8_EUPED|nr:unnamed protein product [Euphydryas editha]